MAKLILTPEEKAASSWFELDDATVGKVVKKLGTDNLQIPDEKERMLWYSAALILCSVAAENNSESMEVKIGELHDNGVELGNWKIIVHRIKGEPK